MSEEEDDYWTLMTDEQRQAHIDQLKKELTLDRIKTSEGSQVILEWCKGEFKEDPLIKGIDSKLNPYVEIKKGCTMI